MKNETGDLREPNTTEDLQLYLNGPEGSDPSAPSPSQNRTTELPPRFIGIQENII